MQIAGTSGVNSKLDPADNLRPAAFWHLATMALVAVLLWFSPITRSLHAESSAVVSGLAFFSAGLFVLRAMARKVAIVSAARLVLAAPVVPMLLLLASTAAVGTCWTWEGPAIFVAFVWPASIFGASLGYLFSTLRSWRRSSFVVVGFLIGVASLIFDLKLHPQFYSYSHVFGGLLGPVYDRDVAIRGGMFLFRLVTIGWSLLVVLAARSRMHGRSRGSAVGMSAIVVFLGACYVFRGWLGINTTERQIREALDGHFASEHFDIRFDKEARRVQPLDLIAAQQEYEYVRLANTLGVRPNKRIRVYLYPDAESRAHLTGARHTSIAPVWLRKPQVHMLERRHAASFSHELVHVFSREFGMPLVGASPLVGLVEGLAVALEAPALWFDADDVVRMAASHYGWSAADLAKRAKNAMSPWGFWTDRGAVAYTISGSFVSYVLSDSDPQTFRQFYRTGRSSVFGESLHLMTANWAERVLADTSRGSPVARSLVGRSFDAASLFELSCPHKVPRSVRALADGDEAWARGDTTRAQERWLEARNEPRLATSTAERLGLIALYRNSPEAAVELLSPHDSLLTFAGWTMLADALTLVGRQESSREAYDKAKEFVAGALIDEAAMLAVRSALSSEPKAVASYYGIVPDTPIPEAISAWGWAATARRRGDYLEAIPLLEAADVADDTRSAALIHWYRQANLARASAAAGLWKRAADAWDSAEQAAQATDYAYAVTYAGYRAMEARWIADANRE